MKSPRYYELAVLCAALMAPAMADAPAPVNTVENLRHRAVVLNREVIDNLVRGKITSDEAQKFGAQLSDVVAIKGKLASDNSLSPGNLERLGRSLDRIDSQLTSFKSRKPVWRGLNPHDTALDRKIGNALSAGRVSKEEAAGLQREQDALKAREGAVMDSNNDNLNEVITVANDQVSLETKLDGYSKHKH